MTAGARLACRSPQPVPFFPNSIEGRDMMIPGKKEIDELAAAQDDYCVSIYLPTHRIGDPQDSLRYKNLIGQAEKLLIARGMRAPEAVAFLAPENELTGKAEYWMHLGSEGLAVFLNGEFRQRYPVPSTFAESVSVDRRFRVRPLLPLLTGESPFFILALSKGETRLYLGSRYSIVDAGLPEGTPRSVEEALRYDEPFCDSCSFTPAPPPPAPGDRPCSTVREWVSTRSAIISDAFSSSSTRAYHRFSGQGKSPWSWSATNRCPPFTGNWKARG